MVQTEPLLALGKKAKSTEQQARVYNVEQFLSSESTIVKQLTNEP
jgi:hypothetical protein